MGIPMQEWAASAPPPCDETYSPWFLELVNGLVVALTFISSTHGDTGFGVPRVTVEPSSGAFDSEYSKPSWSRTALKLTAFPSKWPVIVSVSRGPLRVPLTDPVPENEPSHGFSVTL